MKLCPTRIREKRMLQLKTVKKQTLVRSLLFALLLGTPLAASAQDVEINEENFPDENFRNWLLEQDYGADGIITEEEMKGTTYINVFGKNISSLQGIEHFTALEKLVCSFNALTTLDLSKNTALTSLDCYQNRQPATVNVSGCTALTTLNCRNSHITTLDASGCTALTELLCYGNQLTTLNVSGCTALTTLVCYNNQLTTLDVSDCTALIDLYCYRNQIKGASMNALIESLPQTDGYWHVHDIYIYDSTDPNEGNVCTKAQVAVAQAKGWTPLYCDYYYGSLTWIAYDGYDEETSIVQPSTEAVEANVPVYTLSGKKMTGSLKGKKGVYIVGGKKVVIK